MPELYTILEHNNDGSINDDSGAFPKESMDDMLDSFMSLAYNGVIYKLIKVGEVSKPTNQFKVTWDN
tara:strand:- start:337 stop:537 length:201 start_codon:yes stop_codon:yes gene_type:complete